MRRQTYCIWKTYMQHIVFLRFSLLNKTIAGDIAVWTGIQITACWRVDQPTSKPGLLLACFISEISTAVFSFCLWKLGLFWSQLYVYWVKHFHRRNRKFVFKCRCAMSNWYYSRRAQLVHYEWPHSRSPESSGWGQAVWGWSPWQSPGAEHLVAY